MPTTRQKRKPGDVLLSGLPEEKRPRSEKSADSTSSRKPAAKKGKKNRDPNLPYVKLANDLLRRGDELLLSGPSATLGQITEPPRVWGPRDEPINDPTQLPKGWTASETDLAHDDVDGQITRCLRRIDENIMPDIFEDRLKMYQQMKKEQTDMIKSEPDGLSWEVVQRLDSLKKIQASFDELGNDNGNTPNVKAIMAAYRSGDLVWDANSVTYWAHGKLMASAKQMDMDEFLAFSKKYGPHGVWVEGMDNYKPEPMNLFITLHPTMWGHAMHVFEVAIRNPTTWNTNTWQHTIHLTVMEDTGASAMKIFEEDGCALERTSGARLPVTATTNMSTAGGQVRADTVILQVNMFHNGQVMLPRWINIRACITRQSRNSPPAGTRLGGIWLHHMLYCLCAPDNTGDMHVGTDLTEILGQLPPCIPAFANPPPIYK
ncbi:hypothetical protein N7455_005476 [Penicillium solitum]|uniref:uncharacterized protein n=1 Tax=Penicillium solitum TaxID=60172 RepID=UPI0017C6830A|nr:hypothetical protein HAV15_010838 [Penicillium sp. str. \